MKGVPRWCSIICISFLLLLALAGCATPSGQRSPATLADALCQLGPEVDPTEATLLARSAYSQSSELAEEYRAVRPAFAQNILVNIGLRKRGLCYHWAEDLEKRLRALHTQTLELRWAVAHRATVNEHNALVVTAPGASFTNGIVLDAWRNSGRLCWRPVLQDRYPWKEDKSSLPPATMQ